MIRGSVPRRLKTLTTGGVALWVILLSGVLADSNAEQFNCKLSSAGKSNYEMSVIEVSVPKTGVPIGLATIDLTKLPKSHSSQRSYKAEYINSRDQYYQYWTFSVEEQFRLRARKPLRGEGIKIKGQINKIEYQGSCE